MANTGMTTYTLYVRTEMTEVRRIQAPKGLTFEELDAYADAHGYGDMVDVVDDTSVLQRAETVDAAMDRPESEDDEPLPSWLADIAAKLAPLNSIEQTHTITGIPVNTLNDWRAKGKHLRFVKIGRYVFYTRDDILNYLQSQVFSSTAEAKKANR